MVKCTAMFPSVRSAVLLPKAGDIPAGWITHSIPVANVLPADFVSTAAPRRCTPTKTAICTAITHIATDADRRLKDGAIPIGRTIHSQETAVQNADTPKPVLTAIPQPSTVTFLVLSTSTGRIVTPAESTLTM